MNTNYTLKLLDNMQFVYELHLASLEIKQLSENSELLENYRSFSVNSNTDIDHLLNRTAYVAFADKRESDYSILTKKNITRAFNQYITHWFYPYKGKYHPQLVRAMANIIGLKKGDTLLDPFSGSGTTAVEGALLNLETICYDISPLCVLIGKVKANSIHHLNKIDEQYGGFALNEDHSEYSLTYDRDIQKIYDNPFKSFELLSKMIAKSDEKRRGENYFDKIVQNQDKMLKSIRLMKEGCDAIGLLPTPAKVSIADARKLPLPDSSVNGIITSPPYSIALNYVENDSHALEALGYDLNRIKEDFIGVRGSGMKRFEIYEEDMHNAYSEMARVLKPKSKACIVLGNVTFNGNEVSTVDNCIKTMDKLGMRLTANIDKLIYGLYNVMQREWILIFQKE